MKDIKVLLVDDEEEFVKTLSERIKTREMGSEVAFNGKEALSKLEEKLPDVMILDFKMPDIDGLQILEKVKKAYPGVQVVMLTAHGTAEIESKARELGAFDYLQKPVNIETLTKVIEKAYTYKQKFENTMMAATFAEAGDFESAKKLSEKKKKKK
ncbi:MAG: response regulator [Desulfatitalea sp.]|nr:response regulator [Desulfatitalea sp.]NNK01050.1 response regulator [Desulfatitalea sp.]